MNINGLSFNINAMESILEEKEFEDAFAARIKELRKGKDWSAEKMAHTLGIPAERYRKYEQRKGLPSYLIPRFANIVDRSIEYVLTGKDTKKRPQP
jgi:transcriptional regulator with XRE-family HTH domain